MTDTASGAPQAWRSAVAIEIARLLAVAGVLAVALAQFLPERAPAPALPRELPAGWSRSPGQFDAGLAARCIGPACRHPIEITIRPKRGFCDCERDVYDDAVLRESGRSRSRWRLQAAIARRAPDGWRARGALPPAHGRGRRRGGVGGAILDFLNEPRMADWLGGLLKQSKA